MRREAVVAAHRLRLKFDANSCPSVRGKDKDVLSTQRAVAIIVARLSPKRLPSHFRFHNTIGGEQAAFDLEVLVGSTVALSTALQRKL